jgi:hypothetical protein
MAAELTGFSAILAASGHRLVCGLSGPGDRSELRVLWSAKAGPQ